MADTPGRGVEDAAHAVEGVARASYARLMSFLCARSGDVSGAEDALSGAFVSALETWPRDGIPGKPEAWLLQVAHRRWIDAVRRRQTREDSASALRLLSLAEELSATPDFPDERLKLLFVCAHPAIDARVHTPLMLQVVLGLDAAAIAAAFLTPPATMGQRLSRAKAKIKETRIAFEVPSGAQLPARLSAVLEAVYAAYAHGWEEFDGADARRSGLAEEAVFLARLLVELLPAEPEALGLLALLLYCEARRPARRTPAGEYVPLARQDTRLWEWPRLAEAERLLRQASSANRLGRFQLEAAIQSAHVERARGGPMDWAAIALLYAGLVRYAPTIGALVGRAAALAEAQGPAAGLALLDAMAANAVEAYQPYWAVRAHLEQRLGQHGAARAAFEKAIRLTRDPAVRSFLARSCPN